MASIDTPRRQSSLSDSVQDAMTQRVRRNDATDRLVFDRLTKLVSALLDVPVSLLLVADGDQLLFASYAGSQQPWGEIKEFPISEAHCQHALGSRAAFAVEDSRTNPQVCELASTTELGVVAYLGVPLLTSEGEPIGILCALDFEPRAWSETDIRVVEDLAATVMAYIEARPRDLAPRHGGLNIAAVARKTGVAADTLRKWERRYGVLRPSRTAGGQRRYDDCDVSRVEWLRDRLTEGFRIGAAAALLEPTSDASAETPDQLSRALVEAAQEGEPFRLLGLVEQAFTLHPLPVTVEEIVAPALRAVDAYEGVATTIAEEHLLSAAVRSRLERMLSDRRAGVRGKAVLACAPEERHELGLLSLAVMLQADGWSVAYLGAALPIDETLSLARQIEADLVCVSVTLPESLELLATELEAVPADGPLVVVGGAGVTTAGDAAVAVKLQAPVLTGALADVVAQLRST